MENNINTHAVTTPNKPPNPLAIVQEKLTKNYGKQVVSYFDGDKRAAMRFMTGFIDYIRRNPRLIECTPISLINSAMTIASFRFIPSSIAGEAYIIPYKNKGIPEAQFQPGYQGYVTLFYRAGVRAIQGEVVRKNDKYSNINGNFLHEIDPTKSKEERGEAIGAYVKVILPSGEPVTKYMNEKDIISHAKRFSKSFSKDDSPWRPENDPELNMWKKTILLQMKSTLPKNSELVRAMEEDFKDSKINASEVLNIDGPATRPALHKPEPLEKPKTEKVDGGLPVINQD